MIHCCSINIWSLLNKNDRRNVIDCEVASDSCFVTGLSESPVQYDTDIITPTQFIYLYKDCHLYRIGSRSNVLIHPPANDWPSRGTAPLIQLSYWDQTIGRKTQGTQRKTSKSSTEAARKRRTKLMAKTNVVPLLPSRQQLFLMSGESLRPIDFRAMLGAALKEKGPVGKRRIIMERKRVPGQTGL